MIQDFLRKTFLKIKNNRVTINGTKMAVSNNMYRFFSLISNNSIEPELIQFIQNNLKKGDVFVDIGANIGLVSLVASKLVGDEGSVIALEPNPWVFKEFVEIQKLNEVNNIKSLELAASDKNGVSILNMNNLDSMLMTRSSLQIKDEGALSVNILTNRLDDLGLPTNIKILKIDVEGAELDVLNGAINTIKNTKPIVCMEIHGLFFDSPQKHVNDIFDYFETKEYKCFNIQKHLDENFESFIEDTGIEGIDELSGRLFSKVGYGQVVFYHKSELINR